MIIKSIYRTSPKFLFNNLGKEIVFSNLSYDQNNERIIILDKQNLVT